MSWGCSIRQAKIAFPPGAAHKSMTVLGLRGAAEKTIALNTDEKSRQ
jgi:hypothetical protein